VILAIETSCDDTCAAVVSRDGSVLGAIRSSQGDLHARFGGVVPEIASRRHLELVIPVIEAALAEAGATLEDVDAVARRLITEGGYGDYKGANVFTHGIQLGLERNEAHDLRTATEELVDSLSRGNPRLKQDSGYFNTTVDGRRGLHTTLSNCPQYFPDHVHPNAAGAGTMSMTVFTAFKGR
jgi:hypothetical protein